MKVEFCCNSGANIHSCRRETFDLEKSFNISDKEWEEMSEDAKFELVNEWAQDKLEIYWKPI